MCVVVSVCVKTAPLAATPPAARRAKSHRCACGFTGRSVRAPCPWPGGRSHHALHGGGARARLVQLAPINPLAAARDG
jgi:hypothetical protein